MTLVVTRREQQPDDSRINVTRPARCAFKKMEVLLKQTARSTLFIIRLFLRKITWNKCLFV